MLRYTYFISLNSSNIPYRNRFVAYKSNTTDFSYIISSDEHQTENCHFTLSRLMYVSFLASLSRSFMSIQNGIPCLL